MQFKEFPDSLEQTEHDHHGSSLRVLASSKRLRSLATLLLLSSSTSCMNEHEPTPSTAKPAANSEHPVKDQIAALRAQVAAPLPHAEHSGTQETMHAKTHDEHDLTAIREQFWNAEESAYQYALQLAEKPQREVYSPTELAEAFRADVEVFVGCMDERVQMPGKKKVGIGGSCVLFSESQLDQFVGNLRKKGLTVTLVTDHDGCGACALYCKKKNLDTAKAPEIAHETAVRVGEKLGLPETKIRHVGFDVMTGNEHLHHARGIVVDCCGRFCPEALNMNATRPEERKFPASFELTAAAYPDPEQLKAELEVALSIAEGDHGMGKKMFAGNGKKILLTFVEDPSDPALTQSVRAVVDAVLAEHPKTAQLVILKAPAPVSAAE